MNKPLLIILKLMRKALLIGFLIFILLIVIWQIDTRVFHKKPFNPQEIFKTFDFPKDKEACEVKGGIWKKIGPRPNEECNLPASDSGKICTDSEQCQGYCLAKLSPEQLRSGMKGKRIKTDGFCSPTLKTIGCQGFIKNGFANIICLD